MIGEMLARGGTTAGLGGEASAGTTGTGQALTCFGWASLAPPAPGPGTQKQAAVPRFRPCTIPGRNIGRIFNTQDWYRMIPSTTYFLSLREL